jgi:hypothetical protein
LIPFRTINWRPAMGNDLERLTALIMNLWI